MISTANITKEADEIKKKVIGIFKQGKNYSLVMDYQEPNQTVDLLTTTQFLAFRKEFNIPTNFGTLHLFPENKSMFEMLENPLEWYEFVTTIDLT